LGPPGIVKIRPCLHNLDYPPRNPELIHTVAGFGYRLSVK